MDPRRLLILALAGLGLSGCAVLRGAPPVAPEPISVSETTRSSGADALDAPGVAGTDSIEAAAAADTSVPYLTPAGTEPLAPPADEQGTNAVVNPEARAPSHGDAFVGGVRVFAWSPGRVYDVSTAPLRVTTLTLGPGETLISKAAGDTVRWQIGEASSGEGAGRRSHVLIKPLQRGLETNLVLTTNRRVFFLDLRSGGVGDFNAAVAWDFGATDASPGAEAATLMEARVPDPVVTPEGPLDARYAIEPRGRTPRWMPASVFNDSQRTFIAFRDDLRIDEAPALFVLAPDGEAQLVNYRQAGGLFIVDRVFDRAELRLGDRRPQVVRIRRHQGAVR